MAKNIFSSKFIEHLASNLSCETKDVEEAITSFFQEELPSKTEPPKKSSQNSSSTKVNKEPVKKEDNTVHKCERIPRGKKEPCGKNARNKLEVDGVVRWYCGTEKNPCYSSVLGAQKRQGKTEASKTPVNSGGKKPLPKGDTLGEKKIREDIKSKTLLKKFISSKDMSVSSKRLKNGDVVFVDKNTRVLFDRETEEAYGILLEDDSIGELDDESIRWVEKCGHFVKENRKKSKKESLKEKLKKVPTEKDGDDKIKNLRKNIEDTDTKDEEDLDEDELDLDDDEDELDLDDDEDELDLDEDDEDEDE